MRVIHSNKISTVVLWICMSITLILSAWFYLAYSADSENVETETEALINWLFFVSILTISVSLFFTVTYLIRLWKISPKKMGQSLSGIFALIILLFITYSIGNDKSLVIVGYKGHDNTHIWLKITDMWIYSIYVLLGLAFIALFGGILWSYLKKI
jgi:hypothetical protein